MAKPNYSFEKRQRELAKKKKQDEKEAKKRAERAATKPAETPPGSDPRHAADPRTAPERSRDRPLPRLPAAPQR
ncbi:hypothetical protein H1235_08425 [Pseudoxanthomonas sp. NC8]|nr:hypothetical protein H1235_08425 [Pseudoxanthomonas sp. NC8]